jgi:hypothetical protein
MMDRYSWQLRLASVIAVHLACRSAGLSTASPQKMNVVSGEFLRILGW